MGSDGAVQRIDSQASARALAEHILDHARLRPIVVVSCAAGEVEPYVDVDRIRAATRGLADVWVLPSGDASWAFSSAMPDCTQVYGGASRVYPVDLVWVTDPMISPLRFAYGPGDGEHAAEQVISDALKMAVAAGLLERRSTSRAVEARGVVEGIVGGRAFVRTDHGMLTAWPELTVPSTPPERLFRPGMQLRGVLDTGDNRLDVTKSLRPREDLLGEYGPGAVVLGRVSRVDRNGCHVELVPGCRVFVPAADAYHEQGIPLTTVMSLGEVVTAKVMQVGSPQGKGWRLSLTDAETDSVSPFSGCLLPGGPPWLARPETLEDFGDVDEVSGDGRTPQIETGSSAAPENVSDGELAALRAERDAFARELQTTKAEMERLHRSNVRLKTHTRKALDEVARQQKEVQRLREAIQRSANDGALFSDPERQLDFEINLAWARRVSPTEKSDMPLSRYHLSDQFLGTLADVAGVDRDKVVDVIVDVLTGRVHQIYGRDTHQLRSSAAGGSPYVQRDDGATCWRVALQRRTPQARRLHYWQLPDGSVELSSIRKHDDMRS